MTNDVEEVESNSVEQERHYGPISPKTVLVEYCKENNLLRRREQKAMRTVFLSFVCFVYLSSSKSYLFASAYKSGFVSEGRVTGTSFSQSVISPTRTTYNWVPNSVFTLSNPKNSLNSFSPLHNSLENGEKVDFASCYKATDSTTTLYSASENSTLGTPDEPDDRMYQRAIKQTIVWVLAAGLFGAGLIFFVDPKMGEEFYAGYLVEQSLSVDNLFVFLLLFDYFKVPIQYQNKVLNWGIFGAVVMRAVMIGIGAAALHEYHSVLLFFASFLVYSSVSMLTAGDDDDEEETDMSDDIVVKFSRRFIDSTDEFDGDNFFTMQNGVKIATPLFLCMVAVEISDVVFAVDSIPAVFGVTENPFVVWSSNMFAIMGLRSLYTILSKAASDLKYLEPAVALVLGFIGSKMIAEYVGYDVPTIISLSVVATLLGSGIMLSIYEKNQESANDVIDVTEN